MHTIRSSDHNIHHQVAAAAGSCSQHLSRDTLYAVAMKTLTFFGYGKKKVMLQQ